MKSPLVISGGIKYQDIIPIAEQFELSGVAMGSPLHYENLKISKLKKQLLILDIK